MATINKTVKGADPKVDFGAIVAPLEGYLKELDQFLKDQVELLEPEVQLSLIHI